MKIQLIGQALDEIKEEDQNNLSILEENASKIEAEYSSKRRDFEQISKEHARLEEIDSLSRNVINHLHMIMPVVEIPLGVLIGIVSLIIPLSNSLILTFIFIALACEFDAINTLVDKYPKILDSKNKGIKAYIAAFKKLLANKKDIRHAMISVYNVLLDMRNEVNMYEIELSRTRNEADAIRRELLHLEGYISSIEYIVEKQYFEELSDTTDIVQFINSKKELKKVVSN